MAKKGNKELAKPEPPLKEEEKDSNVIAVSESGYMQWAVNENGAYIPTFKTTKKVPPGVYEISSSPNIGYFLVKQNIILSDSVLELPIKEPQEILDDINNFWKLKEQFKKYKMVYKRGILMHGPPGCGKSYLIQSLTNKIVSDGGIVFTLNSESKVEMFTNFCQIFRQIEPDRPLLVVMEDIDNIVSQGHGLLSALLNVLDGVNQIDNVVYLATTNYPEKLQDRIANRPSRFDRMYEIGLPDDDVREFFIRAKLHPDDLKKIDMQKWIDATDGYTLSHIKEIIVSTMIFGKEIEDVCKHFETMKRPKSSRKHNQVAVGESLSPGKTIGLGK
jgi:AAA+ superfamily predicted ATPase